MANCTLVRYPALIAGIISLVSLLPPFSANLSHAAILNGGFESDFTGWIKIGESFTETSEFGVEPTEGTYNALLLTGAAEDGELGSVSDSTIESFLGLASGSLDTLIGADAIEGSAIGQTFTAKAGDYLSFDWNFLTNEATPETEGFNDFAFVSVNGTVSKLADTFSSVFSSSANEFDTETGFTTSSYIVTADGTYSLGLGVLDTGDNTMGSGLLIDNVKLENNGVSQPIVSVPEPSLVLGLLGFAASGFCSALCKQQKRM